MHPNTTALRAEQSAQWMALAGLVLFAALYFLVAPAFAGGDATFDPALATVAGYVNGSAGKLAAVSSLLYGIVRMTTSGWSLGHVGVPLAVGISAGLGGPIVQSSVTALI